MKKIWLLLFCILMSCSQLIDRPKNLVPKKTMSEIIAQFAMNDQLNSYFANTNLENATRTVLKERKTTAEDFRQSYKYYTASGDLENILADAQEIILDKDPKAKDYIKKKLKENPNAPAFAR